MLQELNLYYHYPRVIWNSAVLITNAEADEDDLSDTPKSTDYGKVAKAIGMMQKEGVEVALPLINEADYGFTPDIEHDRIIYGLKCISGINDGITRAIIANRPFSSMDDFYEKMIDSGIIKNAQMISLIKAGCFCELHHEDRRETMKEYLMKYVYKGTEKLGLGQLARILALGVLPRELSEQVEYIMYRKELFNSPSFIPFIENDKKIPKAGYHDRHFKISHNKYGQYVRLFGEDAIVGASGTSFLVSEKKFDKLVDSKIEGLKTWFTSPEAVSAYNQACFKEIWDKHADGTVPSWEMQSLSYYYTEHELKDLNKELYGVVNFSSLPEDPIAYDATYRTYGGQTKQYLKYSISRLAGTVINSDNTKHIVTLLTQDGDVVSVKFDKGRYSHYNRRISKSLGNGKKTVVEESWFKRGQLLLIAGYRRDDQFKPTVYKDTIYTHCVAKIESIDSNGEITITTERARAD